MPTPPHTIGEVGIDTGWPSAVTPLPLLSISNCCTYEANDFNAVEYAIIARVSRPSIDRFHTFSRPISTGALRCNGAVMKCSSIARMPESMLSYAFDPKAMTFTRFTADEIEYRPPTHDHMGNAKSADKPALKAFSGNTDTTAKCFDTFFAPTASEIHCAMMRPLLKVSAVLNDFEHNTTNVVSGSQFCKTARTSVGSILETK